MGLFDRIAAKLGQSVSPDDLAFIEHLIASRYICGNPHIEWFRERSYLTLLYKRRDNHLYLDFDFHPDPMKRLSYQWSVYPHSLDYHGTITAFGSPPDEIREIMIGSSHAPANETD